MIKIYSGTDNVQVYLSCHIFLGTKKDTLKGYRVYIGYKKDKKRGRRKLIPLPQIPYFLIRI